MNELKSHKNYSELFFCCYFFLFIAAMVNCNANAQCKIMTNIMTTHGIKTVTHISRNSFLNYNN